jgi:hypothetical protein
MYLFQNLGVVQLLKFTVITALLLSFACALAVTLFPNVILDLVESAVLTRGSIEDIETLRRLRQGGQ